jgi:hypothetical protein
MVADIQVDRTRLVRPHRLRELATRYLGVGGGLLVLVVLLGLTQDQFATVGNFVNIFETNAVLLVAGVGLTFVLLTGGFDLSAISLSKSVADPVGHYSRPDVTRLWLDRGRRAPVEPRADDAGETPQLELETEAQLVP